MVSNMKSSMNEGDSGPGIIQDPSSGALGWSLCGVSSPGPVRVMLWLGALGCKGPVATTGCAVVGVTCGTNIPSPGIESLLDGFGGESPRPGWAGRALPCTGSLGDAWILGPSSGSPSFGGPLLLFFCGGLFDGLRALAAASDFGGEGGVECLRLVVDLCGMVERK